jgi:hypothetical protein
LAGLLTQQERPDVISALASLPTAKLTVHGADGYSLAQEGIRKLLLDPMPGLTRSSCI